MHIVVLLFAFSMHKLTNTKKKERYFHFMSKLYKMYSSFLRKLMTMCALSKNISAIKIVVSYSSTAHCSLWTLFNDNEQLQQTSKSYVRKIIMTIYR